MAVEVADNIVEVSMAGKALALKPVKPLTFESFKNLVPTKA